MSSSVCPSYLCGPTAPGSVQCWQPACQAGAPGRIIGIWDQQQYRRARKTQGHLCCVNTQGKRVLNMPSFQTSLFHIKTHNLTVMNPAKPGMLCAFLPPKLQLTMGSKFWDSPPVKDQRTGELCLCFRRGAAPPLHIRALQGSGLCKPHPIRQLSALPAAIQVSTGDWEILHFLLLPISSHLKSPPESDVGHLHCRGRAVSSPLT